MTQAERKARSRTNALGPAVANLEMAIKLAADWQRCMRRGRPGATDKDIEDGFSEISLLLLTAQASLPRS
jgi:hypothetical protein